MTPPPGRARLRGSVGTTLRAALGASLGTVLLWGAAGPVSAGASQAPSNPRTNVARVPDFLASGECTTTSAGSSCQNPCISAQLTFPVFSNDQSCTAYVLLAVDHARKRERIGPMVLPTNWFALTPPEQLFVIADLERTARGLPPYLGLNASLSAEAQWAAQSDTDPGVAPGFPIGVDAQGYNGMGGTWASGFSVLAADYGWMYDDGWGGSPAATSNLNCTWPSAPACWAHRDELLGYDPAFNPGVGLQCRTCEMGTGFAVTSGFASFADLIELPAGPPPAMTFTFARNVLPFMPKPGAIVVKKNPVRSRPTVPRRSAPPSSWHLWSGVPIVSSPCLATARHGQWDRLRCRQVGSHHNTRQW